MGSQGTGIDLLLRNKEQNLVALATQDFGHGQTRKKVSSGSSACDGKLHNQKRTARLVAGTTRERRFGSRRPWRWMLTRMPMSNIDTARLLPP